MSLVNKKGVDISKWNGDVNFEMLKRNGISFVMIGMGDMFNENVAKAEKAGMPWGAYFYTYSINAAQDKGELETILSRLKGKKPTMPIALDVEDSDDYKKNCGAWTYDRVTQNTKYILEGLAKAGYYPMLYTGFEEIENYLPESIWKKYDMWWAQWSSKCGYPGNNLGMWQFGGETNYICSPYIEGETFDQNYCYKDYPTIIKSGGYNGWAKGSAASPVKTSSGNTSQSQSTSKTPTVATVQKWLNTNFNSKLDVDGIYGSLTKAALVKALQKTLGGLDVDGIFGYYTKGAVRNLSNGDSGKLVYILQGLLLCNGYGAGGFDGVFGSGTEAAVTAYQYQHALDADGIAGPQTFESLCS